MSATDPEHTCLSGPVNGSSFLGLGGVMGWWGHGVACDVFGKEKVAGSIPVSRFPHIYKKNEGFRTLVFLLFGNEFGNVFK